MGSDTGEAKNTSQRSWVSGYALLFSVTLNRSLSLSGPQSTRYRISMLSEVPSSFSI